MSTSKLEEPKSRFVCEVYFKNLHYFIYSNKMFIKNPDYKLTDDDIEILRICSCERWTEIFQKITMKSYIIKVPGNVFDYLQEEMLILPKECNRICPYENRVNNNSFFNDDEIPEDEDYSEEPEFHTFSMELIKLMRLLDNNCFIKTNWHSPKDAAWITLKRSLKCQDLIDIYQLLKASSVIKDDISLIKQLNDLNGNFDLYLILKEWNDIHPSTEFRCFVKNNNLIGISPKHWPEYHSFIDEQKFNIINDIVTLFKENIKGKFPIKNFVFDAVREKKDNVFLIDFSPFNENFTNSLAFTWDELNSDELIKENIEDTPELRYLPTDIGIQPTERNNYGIPRDIFDMFQSNNSVTQDCLARMQNLS